jgi:hypothetical protein
MKKFSLIFVVVIVASFIVNFSSCYYDNEEYLYGQTSVCADTVSSYNGHIKAILNQKCAYSGCHAGTNPSSGIGLDSYALAKDGAINGFMCTINWETGCSKMPKNANQLGACDREVLQRWIDRGYPEN